TFDDALASVNLILDDEGLVAFDAEDQRLRDRAVRATLAASMDRLPAEERTRYEELAIFPEDVDVPLATVHQLWGATAQLSARETEKLAEKLHRLALLARFDLGQKTLRLHDVLRTYLREQIDAPRRNALQQMFLATYGLRHWRDLPETELYLWNH